MIKSISLKNFQSHKSSRLELDPGVNAIVGQSDSGKTAILRALNWVLTNRPAGDAFRSSWGGTTDVKINVEDGCFESVTRLKSDRVNEYWRDNEAFKAMGQDVPEPVAKLLNMGPVNYQSQMDAPFLLSSTPGEVARVLNEVVGLEDIDRAIANSNRMVRQASQDLDRADSDIRSAEERLGAYGGLDEALAEVASLESLFARRQEKAELADAVGAALRDLGAAAERLESARLPEGVEAELDAAEKMNRDADSAFGKLEAIEKAAGDAEEAARKAATARRFLEDAEARLKALLPPGSECPTCGQVIGRKH